MLKRTKIILAAGALGLVAAGAAAGIASADMGGNGGWGGGHGGWGRHGGMMMMMTERYDANKDGKIDQAEIDQNRTAWHGEFDGDKNGSLSLDEFQGLWLKAQRERMVREFQRFDRDGNGQVTLDEYKQPMSEMFAQMDRNDDGFLSDDDHMQGGMHHKRMRGMHGGGAGPGMGGPGMGGQGEGPEDGDSN